MLLRTSLLSFGFWAEAFLSFEIFTGNKTEKNEIIFFSLKHYIQTLCTHLSNKAHQIHMKVKRELVKVSGIQNCFQLD